MYLYILFGLLGIITLFLITRKNALRKKWGILLLAIFLIFLVLRFPIGTDIDSYTFFFHEVSKNPLVAINTDGTALPNNPGFLLLMCFAKNIFDNFNFFIFIFNLINYGIIGYVTFKYSKNYLITMLIILGSGIVEVYMSGVLRQMCIMSIFLFAYYEFLQKNKYILYYLSCLLALSFHWLAFFLFLVPIFKVYFEYIKNIILRYILPIILASGLFVVFTFVVPKYTALIPGRFGMYFNADTFSLIGLLSRIAILGVVLFAYWFADKEKVTEFEKFSVYLCFISFLFYLVFCSSSVFSRLSDMFSIIEIVLVANLIMKIPYKKVIFRVISLILVIGVNAVCLYADVDFVANYSLINHDKMEYPMIWVWDDINFSELFQDWKYEW